MRGVGFLSLGNESLAHRQLAYNITTNTQLLPEVIATQERIVKIHIDIFIFEPTVSSPTLYI